MSGRADSNGLEKELEFWTCLQRTQTWHHEFWSLNNAQFAREKDDFIQAFASKHSRTPTSEDLSLFYKSYLNENHQRHLEYYKQWWLRNLHLLRLGLKAEVLSLARVLMGDSLVTKFTKKPTTRDWTSGQYRPWYYFPKPESYRAQGITVR
jgi:hypothetical protein